MKDHSQDPWTVFTSQYQVGDVANVRVVKLMTFGAFAEIVPGVDGLIHISQIADHRIEKPGDVLAEGEKVDAKIIGRGRGEAEDLPVHPRSAGPLADEGDDRVRTAVRKQRYECTAAFFVAIVYLLTAVCVQASCPRSRVCLSLAFTIRRTENWHIRQCTSPRLVVKSDDQENEKKEEELLCLLLTIGICTARS